jgi:hypothetical protein
MGSVVTKSFEEDGMEEVEFDVDIRRNVYLVPITGFVLDRLR